jgi:hypothetical protein
MVIPIRVPIKDHHAKRNVRVIYTFKYRAAIEILPISQKLFTALSKQDIASALNTERED